MFSKFHILVIYFIIQSICANVTPSTDEKTTLSVEEQVQKELFPIEENLKNIKDPSTNKDENMWLKGVIQGEVKKIIERAVKADQLIQEKGRLEEKKERAVKEEYKVEQLIQEKGRLKEKMNLAEEWGWLELLRQQIEFYEENNFPQPCDSDFEEKKIVWDQQRLKGKTNHELHEERRYQKFKYYLENPPNESVEKLRRRLDQANVTVETFSKGVAKAYRLISARIHDGYMKWLDRNLDEFFHQQDVLTATKILLDEMGVSEKLIRQILKKGENNNK